MNSLDSRLGHGAARHVAALLASVAAVALVTGAIFALDSVAPVLSLGVLYVFAVLPVAVFFGLGYALLVSVASMLAFNWFFLPPTHTFRLTDGDLEIGRALRDTRLGPIGGGSDEVMKEILGKLLGL